MNGCGGKENVNLTAVIHHYYFDWIMMQFCHTITSITSDIANIASCEKVIELIIE